MKLLIILSILLVSTPSFSLEEGVYTIIVKKQAEKKASRWSLADWLVTKNKISLMDQWLALHSSSTWFEFIFEYGEGALDETTDGTTVHNQFRTSKSSIAMYVKFLGVEYNNFSYTSLAQQSDFRLNLLLIGSSVQSTHMKMFYGKRKYEHTLYSDYDQSFYGAGMNLYLTDFLGFNFQYTSFAKQDSADKNYSLTASRTEYGVFIELWLLRFYLEHYKESSEFSSSSTIDKVDEGYITGMKLYF